VAIVIDRASRSISPATRPVPAIVVATLAAVQQSGAATKRLYDQGARCRLEQMDAAGIDYQILSLFDPGSPGVDRRPRGAIDLARSRQTTNSPRPCGGKFRARFGGFRGPLATQDPDAAATELERAVTELGPCRRTHQWAHPGGVISTIRRTKGSSAAPPKRWAHRSTLHPHEAASRPSWRSGFAPYVADGLHLASWGFARGGGERTRCGLIYSGFVR